MDNTNNQPASVLDPEAAYAVVHQRVYAPRFFEKLASDYGIQPRSDAEVMRLLAMADRLRQAYDTDQQKQAAAAGSEIEAAYASLDQKLGGAPQGDVVADRFRKQAAANGARDAELVRAVLSLQIGAQPPAAPAAAA